MKKFKLSRHAVPLTLAITASVLLSACGGGGGGSTAATPPPVATYTISGSVTGLASGTGVTLLNNGGDPLTVSANGALKFSTPVAQNGSYAVTTGTQPVGQTCTVSHGTGTALSANITDVSVTCSAITYTVTGTVTGLNSGAKVTLKNNAASPTTVAADGAFSFVAPVAFGASYSVAVTTQPLAQECTVANGSADAITANVSNVTVTCGSPTETVIQSFAAAGERAALLLGSDGNFYGTTPYEGSNGVGTVFQLTPAGVKTILHSFGSGADGIGSIAALVAGSDGNFYGTTIVGGTSNKGTVYQITPAGVETVIYSFAGGTDGMLPGGSLISGSDGNFYGTTSNGGTSGNGTVFKVTPAGVETVIYSFAGGTDGAAPGSSLISDSDGNFYGTTSIGGTSNQGTVFKVTSAGMVSVLYSFAGGTDGQNPQSALIAGGDGNFYGTTPFGGANGKGTIFSITSAGMETVLYSFAGGVDGSVPKAALLSGSDGKFYGTTSAGGTSDNGTIFSVTPAGVETVLYSFAGGTDGSKPNAPLILGSDGYFYGTTWFGGATNQGAVFRY